MVITILGAWFVDRDGARKIAATMQTCAATDQTSGEASVDWGRARAAIKSLTVSFIGSGARR